jgi:hypothetical protein
MDFKALLVTACGATRLSDWVEPAPGVRDEIVVSLTPTTRPYYNLPVATPLPEDTTLHTRRFRLLDEISVPFGPRVYVYLEEVGRR